LSDREPSRLANDAGDGGHGFCAVVATGGGVDGGGVGAVVPPSPPQAIASAAHAVRMAIGLAE